MMPYDEQEFGIYFSSIMLSVLPEWAKKRYGQKYTQKYAIIWIFPLEQQCGIKLYRIYYWFLILVTYMANIT